jgi:hypothetical protein
MNVEVEIPKVKIEESQNVRKFYGPMVLTRGFFKFQEGRKDLYVGGPLTICPDVPAEDFEEKLGQLTVYGPLRCPEYLLPLVQPRLQNLHGPTVAYGCTPTSTVVAGDLVLREAYLDELDDGTELAVIGRLRVPQVLPNELIERKIERLYVLKTILCHEENAQVIDSLVHTPRKMTVVPAGFELVERPFVLSPTALAELPGKRLYCTARVEVDPAVDASQLDRSVDEVICQGIVFCPAGLAAVISQKTKWFQTRLVIYEGELWIVDGERTLQAVNLEHLQGQATLVVYGELAVDADVNAQLLAERLHKVHNLGEICCTPEQMEAIRGLLGLDDGDLVDSTEVAEGME